MTDRAIFKHEENQTSEKRLIRAEFVGNPEELHNILRITKKADPSAMNCIKPWSEFELLWPDNKAIKKVEAKKTYQTKKAIDCEA